MVVELNVCCAGLPWISRHTRVARSSPIAQAPQVSNCSDFCFVSAELHLLRCSCVLSWRVWGPVQVLVLHLERGFWSGSGQQVKLAGHVRFPLQFDLRPFTVHAAKPAPTAAVESGTGRDSVQGDLFDLIALNKISRFLTRIAQLCINLCPTPKSEPNEMESFDVAQGRLDVPPFHPVEGDCSTNC